MTDPHARSPLRIGLLGASDIAPTAVVAPARQLSGVEIVSVAARDPARAEAYARQHDIGGWDSSYRDLLTRDDVDLVYIALTPAAHEEWAIRTLDAGKAVLCEKPFAMNAAEAARMVAAGRSAGLALLEAAHYRFHRLIARATEIIDSNVLGPIRSGEGIFEAPIHPTSWRWLAEQGGGALMDLGFYPIHAMRTLLRGQPTVLTARQELHAGVDAATEAELEFPGGSRMVIRCSMRTQAPAIRLRLDGDRGSLLINNYVVPQFGHEIRIQIDGQVRTEQADGPGTYAAQLAHAADVVRGRTAPLTGGEDAIANMAVLDAVREAAVRPGGASH